MDSAIFTLMIVIVLAAAGVDGTKIVVSLPDGEPLAMANAIGAIANATKKETKILEMKLDSIEILLKKMMSGSLKTELKPNLNPMPEPSMPASAELGTLVEISYNGTAGASSVFNSEMGKYGGFLPKNAFTDSPAGTGHIPRGWSPPFESEFPHFVWFHFRATHRLAEIGFKTYSNRQAPKSFDVVGSDDCANWTKLLAVANSGFPNNRKEPQHTRHWNIPKKNRIPFECIGLKIYSVIGFDIPEVKSIIMWEEV